MLNRKIEWKNGKKCAAMITINLDAEYFGKIYYPDMDVSRGECKALGRASMKQYLPKVLAALEEYGVEATFFIPGAVAREYPEEVKDIARRGHEIACHGNYHENLALLTADEQRKALSEAKNSLKEISGIDPTGFRMPEGEMSRETLSIVKELGFIY